jgi:hypothetical protein
MFVTDITNNIAGILKYNQKRWMIDSAASIKGEEKYTVWKCQLYFKIKNGPARGGEPHPIA